MNQQRWMLILPNPRRAFVTYRLRTQQSPPSSKPGGKKMQNSKTPRNPIAVARSGQKELSYTTNTRGQSRAVSHLGCVPSLSPPSLTRGWTSPLPPPPPQPLTHPSGSGCFISVAALVHEAGCDAALVPRQREDALLSGHALGWAGVFGMCW